ncbi:hypothetical protein IW492_09305 [Enterococcus sp. BWB1-3]|uniref:hypothetical protein n=1 Tax=Enterococcus sp. BWB1-3 TaxID=2787713 RepID=UPI0019213733|nr:hypothetical protein [Enterococcus sp. BWB1-3]MBL1229427.1 hypothetical protein [Enterococcus sp. BWB1-3]
MLLFLAGWWKESTGSFGLVLNLMNSALTAFTTSLILTEIVEIAGTVSLYVFTFFNSTAFFLFAGVDSFCKMR